MSLNYTAFHRKFRDAQEVKPGPLFFRQYAKNLLLKSLLDIVRCAYRNRQFDIAVAAGVN